MTSTATAQISVFDEADLVEIDATTPNHSADQCVEPGAIPGHAPGSFSLDLPIDAYHGRRDFISHTGMIQLLRSPAHYFEYLVHPRKESSPNIFNVAHAAILEPDEYASKFVVYEGARRGKAWTEFQEANSHKQIITASERETVEGMLRSVREFADFPLWRSLELGESEKSIFWTDENSGAKCRIRADSLNPHVILDLKGIDDARPDKVQSQIARMDYDLQAYMYSCGVHAFTGRWLPFYFIFVEDKRPHQVCMVRAGQSVLANGFIKFRRGTARFAQLCSDGDWCGYSNSIYTAEMPRYAMLTPENDSELMVEHG